MSKRQIMINLDDAIASITCSIEAQLGSCKMTIVNLAHDDIRLLEGNEREKFIDNVARNILAGMQDNTDHVDDAIEILARADREGGATRMAEAIVEALHTLRGEESATPRPHVAAFRCHTCGGMGTVSKDDAAMDLHSVICITCGGTGVLEAK